MQIYSIVKNAVCVCVSLSGLWQFTTEESNPTLYGSVTTLNCFGPAAVLHCVFKQISSARAGINEERGL